MASSWGNAWAKAWGGAWGPISSEPKLIELSITLQPVKQTPAAGTVYLPPAHTVYRLPSV